MVGYGGGKLVVMWCCVREGVMVVETFQLLVAVNDS